jgi:hypothetical protein
MHEQQNDVFRAQEAVVENKYTVKTAPCLWSGDGKSSKSLDSLEPLREDGFEAFRQVDYGWEF